MSLPVSVEDLAEELQLQNDQAFAYLHRHTGETIILIQHEIDCAGRLGRLDDGAAECDREYEDSAVDGLERDDIPCERSTGVPE